MAWSSRTRRFALLASAIGGMLETSAHAQTAPAGGSPGAAKPPPAIEEVIVTAEKRSERINRVPLSIVSLSSKQLTQSGVRKTEDLARVVPGFTAVTSVFGTPVYYLRGVGFYDSSINARPAVTIYSDEATIPYSVMALGTTLDLERVEVLKGPQGTLFGSNSTGGAINFIAAKPTDHFHAGVDAGIGRFADGYIDGFVSGPISDKVDVRLAASHEGADDWQKNYINGQTIGAKNISSFRASVLVKPTDSLKLLFTLNGTHDGSDPQIGQLSAKNTLLRFTPAFAAFPLAPHNARATAFGSIYPNGGRLQNDDNELQGTLRADYDVSSDIRLTSLTSVQHYTQSGALNPGSTTLQVGAIDRTGGIASWSQEVRAAGSFLNSRGRWILGANVERDRTYENTAFDLADESAGNVFHFLHLPPINDVPTILHTTYKSAGVFGNLDYNLTDTITAHGGLRYTETDINYNACSADAGNQTYAIGIRTILNLTGSSIPPLFPGECVNFAPAPGGGFQLTHIAGSINQSSVSWRGGLDWKPTDRTLVYANISRGFKAAAVSNIASVFASQLNPVPQEQLTSYEVGTKTDIVPLTQLNVAAFYYNYLNKQLQGTAVYPIFGPVETLVSVPRSHVYGLDLQVITRPLTGLTLGLSGVYVYSAVDGSVPGTSALGPPTNFQDSHFPNTPRLQGALTGQYDWHLNDRLNAFAGASLTYRSASNGDFNNNPLLRIPGYALLDANVGITTPDGRWTAELWGHNITNRYYWTSQLPNLEPIVRYAGLPMTYGFNLSYRY